MAKSKPFTSAVPTSGDHVGEFATRLDNAVDLIAIIRQIKSFLVLIGQWDRLIEAIAGLKDQAPDWIDQVIDAVINWLQAL